MPSNISTTEHGRVNYIVALPDETPHTSKPFFDPNYMAAKVMAYKNPHYRDAHLLQRAQNAFKRLKVEDKAFPEFITDAKTLMSKAGIDLQ
jgi:hypothetical protein